MPFDYATIENSVVTAITLGAGSIPTRTSTTYYRDITADDPQPEVGWFFEQTCLTFASVLPPIAPGDLAPPGPFGDGPGDQPNPGDDFYPSGPDDPTDVRSPVVPELLVLSAGGTTPLTIPAVPAASTVIPGNRRFAFDFTNVCYLRVQADVMTPCPGASLGLEYSEDDVDWFPLYIDPLDILNTGPKLSLAASGYIRGGFRIPAAVGDVLVRAVTVDGDDATTCEIGHLSALAYLRTDTTARCADCPEDPVIGECALPAALAVEDFSAYADDAAWQAAQLALNGVTPSLYYAFADPSYTALDLAETFNGNPTVEISDPENVYLEARIAANTPGDLTFLMRFRVDGTITSSADGSFGSGGYKIAQFGVGGSAYLELVVINTDRLALRNYYTPLTPVVVDLGPVSDLLDANRELIMRCRDLGTGFTKVSIYLHEPCADPVLYHEDDYENDAVNVDYDTVFRWYMSNSADDTVTGTIRILQEAIDTDATVFGL